MSVTAKRFVAASFAVCVLGAVAVARAGQGQVLTLDDLLKEALEENPQIRAAQNNILAARSLKPQAWALANPMVSVENDTAPRNPFNANDTDMVRFGLTQGIPFPAKLFGRSKAASQELIAAQAQYEQTVNAVTRDLKRAYADLFMASHSHVLLEESRGLLEAFRDIANRKYSFGKTTQADVLSAQVEVGRIMNELSATHAQAISAQAALKALLSRPQDPDFTVPATEEIKPVQGSVEELVDEALKTNPTLRASQAQLQKAEEVLGLAKLEYAPDFELRAEYIKMGGRPDEWDGFVGVTVPLWAWNQQGMIAQARAEWARKKELLNEERNKIIVDVRQAFARAQSSWEIVNNLKTIIIPQAEQTLKVSQTAYETDKVDFFTLTGYWRALLDYRIELVRATAQYAQAVADLEQAVGWTGNRDLTKPPGEVTAAKEGK